MKRLCLILALLCLVAVPVTAQVPDEFTNLKIFPKEIGKRELVSAMRQFAGALGVRCNPRSTLQRKSPRFWNVLVTTVIRTRPTGLGTPTSRRSRGGSSTTWTTPATT